MPAADKTERESAWNAYSACNFIEQVVKAFSKCFGLDKAREVTPTISQALKRPPRPPLSVGQINLLSS